MFIPSALRAYPPTFPQHLHSLACSYLFIHICTVHTCFCMSAARRAAITKRFRLRRNRRRQSDSAFGGIAQAK